MTALPPTQTVNPGDEFYRAPTEAKVVHVTEAPNGITYVIYVTRDDWRDQWRLVVSWLRDFEARFLPEGPKAA